MQWKFSQMTKLTHVTKMLETEGPGENVLPLLSSSEQDWSVEARRALLFLFFGQFDISLQFWKEMSICAQPPCSPSERKL